MNNQYYARLVMGDFISSCSVSLPMCMLKHKVFPNSLWETIAMLIKVSINILDKWQRSF